jgi:(1->4)-alpha-D-glucan 1-alpha-D-glucosylmutase
MPGVPDVDQGCELPNYRLVDPDNRGAVDFAVRRELLGDLLDEKLRVTAVSLRLRRDHPHWFTGYAPLQAAGPAMDHIVAFARSAHLITVATRLSARLGREGGWRDTRIELPEGSWVDAITGTEHDGGEQLVGSLLRGGAVALLVPGVSLTA